MPSAEIIAIGSELLLGETQDTNTQYLLRLLREHGINIFRTTIIGDNAEKIAKAIKESFSRADIVITTGGLGPTIDDPTREAAALAFDSKLIFDEALWQDIEHYFGKMRRKTTENNRRQAYIPEIASSIPNEVGTAPAFYIHHEGKLMISLPGVPSEMKHIAQQQVLPLLQKIYPAEGTIVVRTLHSYGLGESVIDELVGDLETSSNPTLGLSAKSGQIDLRITAKGKTAGEASGLIDPFEKAIRDRLGNNVFGTDNDTLRDVTNQLLRERGIQLAILEINTDNKFVDWIDSDILAETQYREFVDNTAETAQIIENFLSQNEKCLSVVIEKWLIPENQFIDIKFTLNSKGNRSAAERCYNGLTYSEKHAFLMGLDLVRKAAAAF